MKSESQSEQRFENMVTVLIATVAIWVAITAYFQNYSANVAEQARRRAQQHSIEATKREVTGAIQYSYEWQGAYQSWMELGWQIVAAEQNGDTAAAERYRQLQDQIAGISTMLGPEYFDPETQWPNTGKYEASTYLVESTRLSETYLAESKLGNFTDDIADSLIVQITLLTVSLSLFGLSMALKTNVRWLFIITGTGIVGVCVMWLCWSMVNLFIRPEVDEAAIQAYSEGVGLAYQGSYEEAIGKYTLAIQEDPAYAKAYHQRGLAYYYQEDLQTALTELEAARSLGLDEINLNWNLGWIYYITGQYDKALEANERVLSEHPEVLGMRMNQAITYLAMGDITNAQAQYDILAEEAQRQINEAHANNAEPSASLWYYMDAGVIDLQNLIDQLDNNPKPWSEAPTPDLIQGDKTAVRNFAFTQMIRLKETIVALEYNGQLPRPPSQTQVEPFVFGQVTSKDKEGLITEFEPTANGIIPYGENGFTVEFTYSGPPPARLIWKVYINGTEDQTLRVHSEQDLSAGNTWYQTFGYEYTDIFILSSGEYMVELYVDDTLVQSGTLFIQE